MVIDAIPRSSADSHLPLAKASIPSRKKSSMPIAAHPLARIRLRNISILILGGLLWNQVAWAGAPIVTTYTYDAGDNVTSVTDPRGLVTRYNYDGLGQMWQQTSPDTGTTSFNFDGYGRRASMTRANGVQTTYSYDSLNRVIGASAGGQTQVFTYDNCTGGIGRLCSVSDAGGSTSYSYTPEGWMTGRGFTIGGKTYALGYSYNAMGQLTAVLYPDNNKAIYTYDNGVVSQIALVVGNTTINGASAITYQPMNGAMASWTSSNGLGNSFTYDTDSRIAGINTQSVQGLAFTYDAGDRITGIVNSVDGSMSQDLAYDEQSRLASVYSTANSEAFQYDADGNRLSHEDGDGLLNAVYGSNSNQLTNTSGVQQASYGYDALGNTTTINGVLTYQYNPFNRLVQAGNSTYYVNPEGQRLEKVANGIATYFAPDLGGPLLAENDGGTWVDYVWLNGTLVERIAGGQVDAVHDDQLGRPEVVTNASQQVVWQAQNFAFDRRVASNSGVTMNLGFPGQYYDAETGLWNNGFRDYNASMGRYIESDPSGLGGGVNTYTYASGDPINNVDPTGLLCFDFNKFADYIRDNRLDPASAAAALGATLGIGTMPKVPSELRGLGVPQSELNPYTSQLSRWSGRFGTRSLRLIGRTSLGVAAGTIATGATIFEGFYDLSIEAQAAAQATSSSDCDCNKEK
jgi:RHS repeat-associated protein